MQNPHLLHVDFQFGSGDVAQSPLLVRAAPSLLSPDLLCLWLWFPLIASFVFALVIERLANKGSFLYWQGNPKLWQKLSEHKSVGFQWKYKHLCPHLILFSTHSDVLHRLLTGRNAKSHFFGLVNLSGTKIRSLFCIWAKRAEGVFSNYEPQGKMSKYSVDANRLFYFSAARISWRWQKLQSRVNQGEPQVSQASAWSELGGQVDIFLSWLQHLFFKLVQTPKPN